MQLLDLVKTPEPKGPIDYWRQHRIDCVVWPQGWLSLPSTPALKWERLRFTEANQSKVTASRGVYAFVVSVDTQMLPPHGYIVYVGITGDKALRTLRMRYGDYLRDLKKGSKRPKIDTMFKLWGDQLDFWYVPCPDPAVDLGRLEKDINTAIITPFVEQDFDDWARPQIKILRSN